MAFSSIRSLFTRTAKAPAAALRVGISRPVAPAPTLVGQLLSRAFASKKHKALIKMAKGYTNRGKNVYSVAKQRVEKAMAYAYRDRRVKKRLVRRDWIIRANAAARQYGVTYSRMIVGMKNANIGLNRKVLADLAVTEPLSFKSVVDVVKSART